MCFLVLSTLRHHLILVHKIKDFDKYREQFGVNLVATVQPSTNVPFPYSPSKVSQIPNGISNKTPKEKIQRKERPVEKKSSEENLSECSVCYKHFSNHGELRKHIRMHGMAFIKSRRKADPVLDWENM